MLASASSRLQAIDALRGLVIVIMLLDHVRETFFLHRQVTDPMTLNDTEPALFWSRMLAHLCAPVFVLLTGLSAYLFCQKNQSLPETRRFLIKRGLFLIMLEFTLVNFAWTASFPPDVIYLQVIWAIGFSMLALALLSGLPNPLQLLLALLIIFGHNLLDSINLTAWPLLQPLWFILHERGWLELGSIRLRTSYPVLPWIGVILLGYQSGRLFNRNTSPSLRNRRLLQIGVASLLGFGLLRAINRYGDQPWLAMPSVSDSVMSFFNLTKYPPSLLFILLTVGIGLLLLVAFDRYSRSKALKPLIVFGSVPMFFYLIHLYALKLLYLLCTVIWQSETGTLLHVDQVSTLWLIAALLALGLYPAVAWFSRVKQRNPQMHWLRYF